MTYKFGISNDTSKKPYGVTEYWMEMEATNPPPFKFDTVNYQIDKELYLKQVVEYYSQQCDNLHQYIENQYIKGNI